MLAVLWVLTLYRFVGWYHHFNVTWCLHKYSDRIKYRDTVQWLRGGTESFTKVCCKECGKPQHPGNRLWAGTTGTVEWYTCDDGDDDDNNNNNDDDDNSWASTWYKCEWVKCVWNDIHTAPFQTPVDGKWKVRSDTPYLRGHRYGSVYSRRWDYPIIGQCHMLSFLQTIDKRLPFQNSTGVT